MTLDELADKEIFFMNQQKEMEEEAKRQAANEPDSDDDEEFANEKRARERDWDDWKDLNQKGAGNKKGGR